MLAKLALLRGETLAIFLFVIPSQTYSRFSGASRLLAEKLFVNSDSFLALNLLLGSFVMLLSHVHDGGSFRAVIFVTVHALEILLNLVGCASMFTSLLRTTLTIFAATRIGGVSSH